jgi:hypothetical protein
VAEPVLLISSDPSLGASLEAVAAGRVRVARLDLARRPVAWPSEPAATVVLDVTARERNAFHAWVRRHLPGPLVVVLKLGEGLPMLAPDPDLGSSAARSARSTWSRSWSVPRDPAAPWPAGASPAPDPPPRAGPRVPVTVLVGLAALLVLAAALVGASLNLHG